MKDQAEGEGGPSEPVEEPVETPSPIERRGGGFALGLFVGALLGAAAALLFAPAPGRDMRRRLRRGLDDARDRLEEKWDDVRDRAGKELGRKDRQ